MQNINNKLIRFCNENNIFNRRYTKFTANKPSSSQYDKILDHILKNELEKNPLFENQYNNKNYNNINKLNGILPKVDHIFAIYVLIMFFNYIILNFILFFICIHIFNEKSIINRTL